jgi:outer membrane protein TolC
MLAAALAVVMAGCQVAPLSGPNIVTGPGQAGFFRGLDPTYTEFVPPADLPPLPIPQVTSTPEVNQVWSLSLREAVNIALRNSNVIRTLGGDQVSATGVTTYDPAVFEASRRAAIAAFDATLNIGLNASRYNQPPSTFFGPGLPENTRRDDGTLSASLVKPWATGGTTSVAYNPPTGYLFFPNGTSGLFNPAYSSNVELFAKQPLLKGAGVDVARAPIRIAQLQADQSVWDVKQATLALVRSVEQAYWSLQAAQAGLQAIDDTLPFIDDVVHIQEERLAEERTIRAEVAKARGQQASFRQSRIAARAEAIKQELLLRNLLGLPPQDGLRIVPSAQPSRAPLQVDPAATMRIATENRPDLMRQRLGIRIREMQLIVAENGLKPQLDLQALYRTSGLSDTPGASFDMMAQNKFTDWTVGANFSVPLGRRAAHANQQAAELLLSRDRMVLRQQLHATAHRLSDLFRQLEAVRNQYDQVEIRVRETEEWLKGSRSRYEDPPPGGDGQDWLLAALNDYLLSIRAQADSKTERAQLLAQYNTLLASLEEAQGTILASYDIVLDGDPTVQARLSSPLSGSPWHTDPAIWNLNAGDAATTPAPATQIVERPRGGRYSDLLDYHQNSVRK